MNSKLGRVLFAKVRIQPPIDQIQDALSQLRHTQDNNDSSPDIFIGCQWHQLFWNVLLGPFRQSFCKIRFHKSQNGKGRKRGHHHLQKLEGAQSCSGPADQNIGQGGEFVTRDAPIVVQIKLAKQSVYSFSIGRRNRSLSIQFNVKFEQHFVAFRKGHFTILVRVSVIIDLIQRAMVMAVAVGISDRCRFGWGCFLCRQGCCSC
mmetsp:Transcript_11577/g.32059  ORF Transcript_11577/g.32059 Transcript_11577/m.32059 type:complete len:204 (+) Transcript_11577:1003-1614(+)